MLILTSISHSYSNLSNYKAKLEIVFDDVLNNLPPHKMTSMVSDNKTAFKSFWNHVEVIPSLSSTVKTIVSNI